VTKRLAEGSRWSPGYKNLVWTHSWLPPLQSLWDTLSWPTGGLAHLRPPVSQELCGSFAFAPVELCLFVPSGACRSPNGKLLQGSYWIVLLTTVLLVVLVTEPGIGAPKFVKQMNNWMQNSTNQSDVLKGPGWILFVPQSGQTRPCCRDNHTLTTNDLTQSVFCSWKVWCDLGSPLPSVTMLSGIWNLQSDCKRGRERCQNLLFPFFPFFFFFNWDRDLLCSLGWAETHYVVPAGLQLTIFLPRPPEFWDYECSPPCPGCYFHSHFVDQSWSRGMGLHVRKAGWGRGAEGYLSWFHRRGFYILSCHWC
jgi:hypothetical protein